MPESPDRESESVQTGFPYPELLLAAIVDSSDDAIVSKNLNGRVTSWNAGAERIFGYTAKEMIGEPILRLIPKERHGEEDRILARLRAGERIDHYETVRMRKDGRPIDVSLTISPVRDANGTIVGASKIARDITEQKETVRKLASANEALARSDRMKVEFISTLSHELRTPLTAIVGWLQILREGASPEEMKEGLEVISRNIRIQSQLINDLLDMSRIEAGKMTLDIQRLDLPAVVAGALESLRPAAEAKLIRLTSAFSSVSGIVMGDRNRLQQIVWNLLANAIKFTGKGGRVHVTIGRVDSHVEICVADNGMGIPQEFLGRIFERFTQADSTTTRRHGGLGLGLAIAKHLTELHGGTIHATSSGEGKGATFSVALPLLPVHVEPNANAGSRAAELEKALAEERLDGVKVLLVEDDVDAAEVVRRFMARHGAEVRIANSMAEGVAAFQKEVPHVLISDIGMPVHDGYELIAHIRALPQGRKIPAVALTALARAEDRTRAIRAGFQMHVAKPVDPAELIAVVRNLANLNQD